MDEGDTRDNGKIDILYFKDVIPFILQALWVLLSL